MDQNGDRRRTPRLFVNLPGVYEVLPDKEMEMPKPLKTVYERVKANDELAGSRLEGIVRDLSATGAFISGDSVPLLSRVLLRFPLPGMSQVEVVGWVLWRRKADCTIEGQAPGGEGLEKLTLPAGFGLLFEYVNPQARRHIMRLIRMNDAARAIITAF